MVNKESFIEVFSEFRGRDFIARCQICSNKVSSTCIKCSFVTSYPTEMVIKTIPHPPQSSHQVPCDFWAFLSLKEKLRDCRFRDVHEMKEAVTKALATFTLEGFQWAFMRWLAATSALNLESPTSRMTEVPGFSEINYCLYRKSLLISGVHLVCDPKYFLLLSLKLV